VIRILRPGDEAALEAFLAPRADTSMFLAPMPDRVASKIAASRGKATYAAGHSLSGVVALAAHCWNGILLVQAAEQIPEVARAALAPRDARSRASPDPPIKSGPRATLWECARLPSTMPTCCTPSISPTCGPAALAGLSLRRPRGDELPRLDRLARAVPGGDGALGAGADAAPGRKEAASSCCRRRAITGCSRTEESPWRTRRSTRACRTSCRSEACGLHRRFAPRLRALRGRRVSSGGARRRRRRAILFTSNTSAARAYEALGFTRAGEYGLLIL